MGTATPARPCMRRSSSTMRLRLPPAAFLCCLLALSGSTLSSCAQTLGQQVSPQPIGVPQSSTQSGGGTGNPGVNLPSLNSYGQQAPSAPMNLPGTTPMTDNRGVFGTGSDIPQTSPSTQIVAGDLLDIIVFETPELSGRFRVNLKGDILLPLAGTLHVAGSMLSEITDAVTQRYKDAGILVNPQVTVFVAEYTRRTITISGEVRAPGLYPVTSPRTLIDTLTMAGGLSDTASRTVSIVHAA